MRIYYPQRFLDADGGVRAVVGIAAWLSRAKHLPIQLFIREDERRVAGSSGVSDALRRRTVIDISNTIGEVSGKCADLNIDVSPLAFQAFCLNAQGGRRAFPGLRSLSIGTSRSPWMAVWDTNTAHNLPFFDAHTHLHSLSLSTSVLPVNLLQVPMSFEPLTELNLTYRLGTDFFRLSPLHVFRILSNCRNLTTCTLTLGEALEAFAFEPQGRRLELPSLRHLSIFDECPTTTLWLMSALYVPSLVRLCYGHAIGSEFDLPANPADDQPFLPIESLQLRLGESSPSPLVELALQLIADDDDDEPVIERATFNYLVRHGESIHELDFKEASMGITELLSLSHDELDGSQVLCPNLQSIVWTTSEERTRNAFLRILRQRCQCTQLRRAQLVFWELSPTGMDQVEEMLKGIVAVATSHLTIEYEIYCWMGPPFRGDVMSRNGVVVHEPS